MFSIPPCPSDIDLPGLEAWAVTSSELLFEGIERLTSGEPYTVHLQEVKEYAARMWKRESAVYPCLMIATRHHDTLEDIDEISEEELLLALRPAGNVTIRRISHDQTVSVAEVSLRLIKAVTRENGAARYECVSCLEGNDPLDLDGIETLVMAMTGVLKLSDVLSNTKFSEYADLKRRAEEGLLNEDQMKFFRKYKKRAREELREILHPLTRMFIGISISIQDHVNFREVNRLLGVAIRECKNVISDEEKFTEKTTPDSLMGLFEWSKI